MTRIVSERISKRLTLYLTPAQVSFARNLRMTGQEDRVSAADMHCRLAPNVSVLLSLLSSSIQVGCRSTARQNIFPRSRLLFFLLFTRVRLNNSKRGMKIPHNNIHCHKV